MKFWGEKNSRKVNSAVFILDRVLTESARLDFLDSSCCLLHICDAFLFCIEEIYLRDGWRYRSSTGVASARSTVSGLCGCV